ncbi:hypothetical protein PRZ48_008855 [Zasmidium cellare]|uniref:Uncharacterized protein n=1 Tax=Zasmidium cellare TaxID=395010 RepID=A0ABR0EHF1_ZASCE|nr:hypothetical protein PRZ48_008855 [Zasmidium cellare]
MAAGSAGVPSAIQDAYANKKATDWCQCLTYDSDKEKVQVIVSLQNYFAAACLALQLPAANRFATSIVAPILRKTFTQMYPDHWASGHGKDMLLGGSQTPSPLSAQQVLSEHSQ